MKYKQKDSCYLSTKITFYMFLLLSILFLLKFNYTVSISYCNANNIPLDFVLPTSGMPFIFGMILTLFILESIGIYYFSKLLKKISFINSINKH